MDNCQQILIGNFTKWLIDNGVNFGDYELKYDGEDIGYSIYTKKCYRENEKIIDIPDSLLITAGKIARMKTYNNICLKHKLKPLHLLVLFFAIESQNINSKFKPYFDILPKTFNTPIMKIPNLNPESLPTNTREFWFAQQKEWKEIEEKLLAIEECKELDKHLLVWAWQLVNTRCIYVENKENELLDNCEGDTIAVIPLVDMLNHSCNANTIANHFPKTSRYCVTSTRSIVEGKQIYVCYGGHDNGRLWIEYGFTLPDNIHNRVKINHNLLFVLLDKLKIKVSSGQKKAILDANYPFTLFASDIEPSYSMRANIRLCLLEPKLLINWRKNLSSIDDNEAEKYIYKEDDILKKILKLLSNLFLSKSEKVSSDLKWLWVDNIKIIEQFLINWEKKKNKDESDFKLDSFKQDDDFIYNNIQDMSLKA
ncbi:SET domain-containing protein [Strongyloides ratti]|uniref:SET domain-containing protein n=1 Tax=Strongyloides ratti TaxID=34506 RepID=A0A090LE62_STRRB|nr:SET domain-containing protein [Strongyloides ratti]CEF66433.1 SET domain-containing protein [Strongyloides ratti]